MTSEKSSSTERVFQLLKYIAAGGSTSNLSEVSRQTGVSRVTTMRLLVDMEQAGFIEQASGSHRLALEFLELAATGLRSQTLYSASSRVLEQLSQDLGLSAYLVIPDGKDVLFMLNHTAERPLVSNIILGSRVPAHSTAPGRILLAHKPLSEVETILGGEALQQGRTGSPQNMSELASILEQDRNNGFAWSHSGLEAGIDACAAAVFDSTGEPIAAISVAGPSEQFNLIPDFRKLVEETLVNHTARLSRINIEN